MITYIKSQPDDIFKVAEVGSDVVVVHACNSMGVWGAGIALQFKDKFPNAYRIYSHWCMVHNYHVTGRCLIVEDRERFIGCLITSRGYGYKKDNEERILKLTYNSVRDLLMQIPIWKTIISPKINNGLFNIPWNKTEAVINEAIHDSGHNIDWHVYEL